MSTFDWSRFSLKIYINSSIQDIYSMLATREKLESWFLRKAEFNDSSGHLKAPGDPLTVGDIYNWLWYGYPDTVNEHGTVREANGADRFSFVFGKAGIVTFQLSRQKDKTEVLLTQTEIPTDEAGRSGFHVGCSVGWTFYLANLKSIMEGGADLRNRDPELSNVINA